MSGSRSTGTSRRVMTQGQAAQEMGLFAGPSLPDSWSSSPVCPLFLAKYHDKPLLPHHVIIHRLVLPGHQDCSLLAMEIPGHVVLIVGHIHLSCTDVTGYFQSTH